MGEVIIVIDEIDLHPGRLDAGYLDDERMIGFVDDEVHSRQADHLVQLVAAFVNGSETGHEGADLVARILDSLRQITSNHSHTRFWHVWLHFGVDE